jgi:CHASE2 domain-containing sensor protein/class 3 adenylate cyclase
VLAVQHGYLENLELVWWDSVWSALVERPSSDVKVVTAVEADFAAWGGSPLPKYFPRDMLAALIRRLTAMHPAVIAVDLALTEQATRDDGVLRTALVWAADHQVPVIVAHDPTSPQRSSFAPPGLPGTVAVGLGPRHEVRWLEPGSDTKPTAPRSMSVLACECYRRRRTALGLPAGPPPPHEAVPIRFWPRDQFATYPARYVLKGAGAIAPEWLQDTIVIIGREDAACQDVKYVPLTHPPAAGLERDQLYGVEVQANCIATLLSPRSPRPDGFVPGLAVEFLVAATVSLAVIWLGIALGNLLSVMILVPLGTYASLLLFNSTGHVLNILPTLLAVSLTGIVSRALEQRRQRSWLGAMVSTPVANALGRQLLPEPGTGAIEDLVVLNFDLRQSSQLALEMNQAQFGVAINELMAAVCAVVLAHDGIVNKYLGDGLLAFWMADEHQGRQGTEAAVASAFAIRDALALLAPRWQEMVGRELHCATTVHCGPAWLGFVGIPRRMEYTPLGRTVDDCFELQELAADSGAEIVVSKTLLVALETVSDTNWGKGKWRERQRGKLSYWEWIQEAVVEDNSPAGTAVEQ